MKIQLNFIFFYTHPKIEWYYIWIAIIVQRNSAHITFFHDGYNIFKFLNVVYLEEAINFITSLDEKVMAKIAYNIFVSQHENNAELFKKLNDCI